MARLLRDRSHFLRSWSLQNPGAVQFAADLFLIWRLPSASVYLAGLATASLSLSVRLRTNSSGTTCPALSNSVGDSIKPPPVLIYCKSGDALDHIYDKSVDVVGMDPPYYDKVMYAELSDASVSGRTKGRSRRLFRLDTTSSAVAWLLLPRPGFIVRSLRARTRSCGIMPLISRSMPNRIDAIDRLGCDRRLVDAREIEELAPAVRPTCSQRFKEGLSARPCVPRADR